MRTKDEIEAELRREKKASQILELALNKIINQAQDCDVKRTNIRNGWLIEVITRATATASSIKSPHS